MLLAWVITPGSSRRPSPRCGTHARGAPWPLEGQVRRGAPPASLDTDRLRPYDPGIGAPEGSRDEDRRLRSHTPAGLCGAAGVDHVRPGRQRTDTRVPALDP